MKSQAGKLLHAVGKRGHANCAQRSARIALRPSAGPKGKALRDAVPRAGA